MIRGRQLALTVTCLVAAVSFAGSVTTWALAWFVLPGVLGAAVFALALVAHRMPAAALIVGGVLVLGWAELTNVATGQTNGPAARSTFVAAGCSLVAVVAAHSRWPAFFLAPVAGIVAGALVLGAGGEVPVVAVATAVCAAVTLGWLEQSRRNWTTPPSRGAALVALSLLVGAAAVGVVLLQAQSDRRQPEVLGPGRAYPQIKPPWSDPLRATTSPSPQRVTTGRAHVNRAHAPARPARARRSTHASSSRAWLYVLAGLLLVLLTVGARLLTVRVAWYRLQARLRAGTPADQVTGAWAWMRLRLEACRLPLADAISPDGVAAGEVESGLPAEALTPLRTLAAMTTRAAFAGDRRVRRTDASAAWRTAGRVEASLRDVLPRRRRVALALRGPARSARVP